MGASSFGKSRSGPILWTLLVGNVVSSSRWMEDSTRVVLVTQPGTNGWLITIIECFDFGTTMYSVIWGACLKQLPAPSQRLPLTRIAEAIRPLPASGER